jgi:tetratricopeptide (TPR) repeat protein
MLRSLTTAILLICFLGIPTLARAQSPTGPDDPATADRVYEAKDWTAAKSAYSGLTKKYPDNARFWFRLGTAQKSLGEFDAAVESFKRAETAGAPKSLVRYALAETRAKKGNTAAAFSLLEEALAAGYAMPDQLSSDPDFSSLRSDTRFAALVERAKRAQTPCRYAPEHRQFDFWIGEWSVTKAKDESPAGDSRIELSLGDCVIVENWTSKNTTYAGKSYNVYNTDAQRWEQFWVDNSAGMIHFIGSLKDGAMDFYTEDVVQPDGTTYKRHLRFFRLGPDKVRQYSQGSTDHGKTWTDEYDFIYTRKKT